MGLYLNELTDSPINEFMEKPLVFTHKPQRTYSLGDFM